MAQKTAQLGGTASNITVAKTAHGLMMMTLRDPNSAISDEEAFDAIKAGVDVLPAGVKMFLNSGEFYDRTLSTGNLELLARFYEKYPDYADKTFLSVKGGMKPHTLTPDSSLENLTRSVNAILAALRGTKKVDLFECARVDRKIPIEEVIKNLSNFVKEGKFDHIGLSECSADTLRRAHAVHPIAAVEIEVSPWSYEEEARKVIATAGELGVAVTAYSPLGRGLLTGAIRSANDLPEGDFRRGLSRLQEENWKENLAIVDGLKAIAERKGITPAELCIAWVASLGPHVIPLPGSSNSKRTLANLRASNIELTQEEKAEIAQLLKEHPVKGDRYNGQVSSTSLLWG